MNSERFNIRLGLTLILLFTFTVWGQWRFGPDMPQPRAGATAVLFNDAVYLFGGKTSGDTVLNTVAKFDLTTYQWVESDIPPFNMPRYNAAAIVYNNEIYLIGGADARDMSLKSVEVYSPAQKKWRHAHSLRKERNGAVAIILRDRLFVLGGAEDSWYDYPDDVEWLDMTRGRWEEAEEDMEEGVAAPFHGVIGDSIFILGGYYIQPTSHGMLGVLGNSWEFQWQSSYSLPEPRAYGVSVQKNDTLYLIGGVNQAGMGVATVDVFSMRNGTFSSLEPLQIARSGAAGVLANQRIFVFGGYSADNSEILASVEYFGQEITSIEEPLPPINTPITLVHLRGYPNPFNGLAHLEVQLPRAAEVVLSIYDLQGRLIQNIFRGQLTAGTHQFVWNATDNQSRPVASGMYLAILQSKNYRKVFKLLYVK